MGDRVSPISVIEVTDLPEPDSPTIATTSPAVDGERDAVDGPHDAVLGAEADAQVVDREQRLGRAHADSLTRGSSQACTTSTTAPSSTTKNAPNITITSTAGTSSSWID